MARLLYFGRLADATGTPLETIDLPASIADTSALRQWIDAEHGSSGALLENTVRLAINNEIASEPAPVSNADEIAFMPPVGGG
ncbi:MAG: molybdopterin converting factor subunit 1 [Pseudomonadota bacterium]